MRAQAGRDEPAAHAPDRALYLPVAADDAGRREVERVARDFAQKRGVRLVPLRAALNGEPMAESPRSALAVLTEVERALIEARELSARLREASALRVLAGAEEALLAALEVPYAHAFLAEVYLQMGLCAAQLGELSLFETRVTEALSLDPRRHVEAAEAPPAVVARARELLQAHDLLPFSETEISPQPDSAQVWLDGQKVGTGKVVLHARQGVHVLVVRAEGYAPYARLLRLEAGKRPPLSLLLSAQPAEQLREQLSVSAVRGEVRRADAARFSALVGLPVYLFQRGGGSRTLISRCEASGCRPISGGEQGVVTHTTFRDPAAAEAWLVAPALRDAPSAARAPWKRWALWVSGAVVLGAGVALGVWASSRRDLRKERALEIDPPVSGMTNTWRIK